MIRDALIPSPCPYAWITINPACDSSVSSRDIKIPLIPQYSHSCWLGPYDRGRELYFRSIARIESRTAMKSLQNIVDALDGCRIRTIVFNVQQRTVTILHKNQPIHGVTLDQLESLWVMEVVAPNVARLLVDQGVLPRDCWHN
jgi:hypothetical protein